VTDAVPTNDNNVTVDIDGATREIEGIGIVSPNGINFRYTDFAPGITCPMHRTTSVDFNILIEGELVLITDDGTETLFTKPGDTIIQRGTIHAWKNPGQKWARLISVIVDARPAVVNGKVLDEAIEY